MVEDLELDAKYQALADPVRRALMIALRSGPARISDVAAPFDMTFAGVSRHVGVLEKAGLISREVRGREHWLQLDPEALAEPQRWIVEQNTFWETRLDALADRLERKRRSR